MKVSYCGFHRHNLDDELIFRPEGLGVYLFVLVLAPMIFTDQAGVQQLAKTGACILFEPEAYQNYRGQQEFFNSFVEFSDEGDFLAKCRFPRNQLVYPDNHQELNHLLQKIQGEYLNPPTEDSQLLQELYLQELLLMAARGVQARPFAQQEQRDLFQEFQSLRTGMLADCQEDWSAERLCQMMQMGKSRFYQLYQAFFHATPKEDLIQARLQRALYHMSNRSVTVQEAAYQAGFKNSNHFHRLFKQRFGCTPAAYRQQ